MQRNFNSVFSHALQWCESFANRKWQFWRITKLWFFTSMLENMSLPQECIWKSCQHISQHLRINKLSYTMEKKSQFNYFKFILIVDGLLQRSCSVNRTVQCICTQCSAHVHKVHVVHMYTSSAHVHNVHKVVHTTQCSAIYVKIITRADYSQFCPIVKHF